MARHPASTPTPASPVTPSPLETQQVVAIPTNRPPRRVDLPLRVYFNPQVCFGLRWREGPAGMFLGGGRGLSDSNDGWRCLP